MEKYSIKNKDNKRIFKRGIINGLPIALGYFAVSCSLRISASNAGLTPLGFIVSLLCNASVGEYARFSLIAAGASYLKVVLITLIINARYLLMSSAISKKS